MRTKGWNKNCSTSQRSTKVKHPYPSPSNPQSIPPLLSPAPPDLVERPPLQKCHPSSHQQLEGSHPRS